MSFGSLTAGVSALDSFEKGIEVIGNNVANVNTTAYKGSTVDYANSFSTILKSATQDAADGSTTGTSAEEVGTGVNIQSISTNFTQGTLASASSESDLGISGNGYFVVVDPSSNTTYVTRAGNFKVDSNGYLTTQGGDRVQGLTGGTTSFTVTEVDGKLVYTMDTATDPTTVGDINISYTSSLSNLTIDSSVTDFTDAEVLANAPSMSDYSISTSGEITISLSDGSSFEVGQVLLQNFKDQSKLESVGDNLYTNQAAAGPVGGLALTADNNTPDTNGLGQIESKSLEGSNVDLSSEFADLITAQRAFQAGSRIITVTDTILEETVNLKRS
jgi:flagellar hook protein FlgE